MSKYIKATSEGRLYIETKDFFKQPEIISTIMRLKDSKLVKEINARNMKRDTIII